MNEPHVTDDELDRMARQLADDASAPPDEHLNQCKVCSLKLSLLTEFYVKVQEELRKSPYPGISVLLSSQPVESRPIRLQYHRTSPDLALLEVAEPTMLLAAQTVSETGSSFSTVATFASETDRAIVRISRMSKVGMYELNLISPGDRTLGRALITLAGIPEPVSPMLTGEDGSSHFALGGQVDWESISILASPSIARFEIGRPITDGEELENRNVTLQLSRLEIGYRLGVQGAASAKHVVIISSDDHSTFLPLHENAAVFAASVDAVLKEILVFP